MSGGFSKPVFFRTAAAVFLGATTGVEGRRKFFRGTDEVPPSTPTGENGQATPTEATTKAGEKVGLVLVDIQKCFTAAENPKGLQLPTTMGKGGDDYKAAVLDLVRKFRAKYPDGPIAMGQDYHPPDHVSFIDEEQKRGTHPWDPTNPPEVAVLGMTQTTFESNNKEFQEDPKHTPVMTSAKANVPEGQGFVDMEQPLFPPHCEKGTEEVNLIDGLCEVAGGESKGDTCEVPQGSENKLRIIRKGLNKGIDSFSMVFDNRMLEESDARKKLLQKKAASNASNGLAEWLHEQGVKKVLITGIADDFCVKSTAFDLLDTEAMAQIADKAAFTVVHLKETAYGIVRGLRDVDKGELDKNLRKEYEDKKITLSSVEQELGGSSKSSICC